MNKINNNIFAKLIASLIAIAVMGFIVVFIFNYYTKQAKENTKNNEEEQKEETKNEELEFITYDKKKTRLFLDKTPIILDIMNTDGGMLISVNDEPLNYVTSSTKIKYLIFNDLLIITASEDDKNIDSISIVNKELDSKIYEPVESRYYNYYLSKPLVNEIYGDYLVVRNNKLYITYTMNNRNNKFVLNNGKYLLDINENDYDRYNIDLDTLLEYTYEITNNDDVLRDRKVFEYTIEDYIKK